jgi:hypothetical protein
MASLDRDFLLGCIFVNNVTIAASACAERHGKCCYCQLFGQPMQYIYYYERYTIMKDTGDCGFANFYTFCKLVPDVS